MTRDSVGLGTVRGVQNDLAFLNNGSIPSRFFGRLRGLIHLVDSTTLSPETDIGVICVDPSRFALAQETTVGIDLFLPLKVHASRGQLIERNPRPAFCRRSRYPAHQPCCSTRLTSHISYKSLHV